MAGMLPMAVFGLEVPCGDVAIQGIGSVRSAFRITMAAIDPSAAPEDDGPPRATLKIIRQPLFDDDEDDEYDSDDFDADEFEREMLEGGDNDDDEEDDEDDEDEDDDAANGGPSDPAKSKKARKAAAEKAIAKLLAEEGEMEIDADELANGVNGTTKSSKAKGKMPADMDEEDDDEEISDIEDDEDYIEEFVICTLDPEKYYQQPLDITIGEDERVFFKVSGTHSVFLTGNYVAPIDEEDDYDEDDEDDELDYDLEPDSDELELDDDEDELDDLEDPRITELEEDLDDDEAPELIKAAIKKAVKKGNKRPADDDTELSATLDDMISKTKAGEEDAKLSKKQLKKQKKNDGSAAVTATETKAATDAAAKSDKKVQFAKNLEQGPTPTKDTKVGAQDKSAKATLGVKTVQGVKIDDKKIGTGPAAKNGDRVGMRYIGKLEKDGKVFDSNKKGKPFSFKLGAGEVIKGWDIGIQGMSIGGERRITIPAHLGYGAKGTAGIPGNSTLVFDVKLLENKGK